MQLLITEKCLRLSSLQSVDLTEDGSLNNHGVFTIVVIKCIHVLLNALLFRFTGLYFTESLLQ